MANNGYIKQLPVKGNSSRKYEIRCSKEIAERLFGISGRCSKCQGKKTTIVLTPPFNPMVVKIHSDCPVDYKFSLDGKKEPHMDFNSYANETQQNKAKKGFSEPHIDFYGNLNWRY